jgi:hypothetical protein
MEYESILSTVSRQFDHEQADIEQRQREVTEAQELLDRGRKALKRKRVGFEKMLTGWQTLDAEVVSGKPAAAEEPDEPRETGDEAAA